MQTRRLHRLGQGANENGRVDASDDRLWVVDVGDGQLHVVQGNDALEQLITSHRLPKSARAYELSAVPRTLGEIPEIAPAFETNVPLPAPTPPKVEVVEVAPPGITHVEPVAPAAEVRSRSGSHDPDFALLDRPFEDDGDYFEDPPRARWLRPAGALAVLAVLVGAGYKLVRSRHAPSEAVAPTTSEPNVAASASSPVEPAPTAAPAAPTPTPAALMPATAAAPSPVAAAPTRAEQHLPDPPAPPSTATATAKPVADPLAAPSAAYSELVAEGQHLFEKGSARKAQALFEQALADQPDGIEALVGLGYAELDRGKVQEAISPFKRALAQDGSHAHALFGLAESYRQQGNRSAALATFKRFLKVQHAGGDADIARQLVQELANGG